MSDPVFAPVPVGCIGTFAYDGTGWRWTCAAHSTPVGASEQMLLDEIVRLRRLCADAGIAAEAVTQ